MPEQDQLKRFTSQDKPLTASWDQIKSVMNFKARVAQKAVSAAPLGQSQELNSGQLKANVRIKFEFEAERQYKRKKRDVHEGLFLNQVLSTKKIEQNAWNKENQKPQEGLLSFLTKNRNQEEDYTNSINYADPQVKNFLAKIQDIRTMDQESALAYLREYAEKPVRVRKQNALIENYQIEAFMVALQSNEHHMVLEKVCVQFRIQDCQEFTLWRLSQTIFNNAAVSPLLTVSGQTYQLFQNERYYISRMNPYQIAVVFNNLNALRYLTIKLNNHLRMCLQAPEIAHGGLLVRENNPIKRESWPLLVAINNNSLNMLMFLWQDLGNKYNVSVGAAFGNINSWQYLKLGQDKYLKKKGYIKANQKNQMPRLPGSQQIPDGGNDHRSKLWEKTHLFVVLESCAQRRYLEGLKFLLSSKATVQIYKSMTKREQLYFIYTFLIKNEQVFDPEVLEILRLKLSEKPYATLMVFVVSQIDKLALENLSEKKQAKISAINGNLRMSAAMSFTGGSFGGKNISNNLRGSTLRLGQSMYNPGGNRASQVRASTVGRASEVYNRILDNAQGGEEHLDQIFQRLNTIQVHLDYAVKNLEAEEILKFKAECEFFDSYCIKNLELLLKLAKDRNPVFFQTGYKIWIAINNIIDWKNQTFNKKQNLKDQFLNGIATFFGRFSQQFTNSAQTGTLDITWNKNQQAWSAVDLAEYQTIVTKNLFYWAKIGAVENFSKAVTRFGINSFNRIRVVYKNVKKKDGLDAPVERKTIAMYHKNLMDNNNVSDDDSNDSFGQTKQKKKKNLQDESNKNIEYKNDKFRHEYKLPDLCPDFTLYQTSISSDGLVEQTSAQDRIYNAESVIAEVTPLLVAIQYKQFNLVHFIIEKMNIDVRMSLTLTSHTRYNIQAKKTGQEIKQKVQGFFQSKFTKAKQSQDSESDNEQQELEKIEKEREDKEKEKRKQALQEPIWIQNLTDEQVSFGLLTAIANEDSLIFRYLWDQLGSYYWGIGQLRCVLKQMIFQKWTYGLNVLFQSETTHQMVKALSSYERTQFVEEYIGLPFSNQFEFEVRQCLVYNLCQEPFACSMIIHIIERFQELQSLSSKLVQRMTHVNQTKTYQSVPLGNNLEDVEQQFSKIWNMCLKSLYPMEIQILKESCQDKFEQFAQTLDHLASENKNLSNYYIQAIKLIQLLKGCSTFKGIFEEAHFPSTDEEDNNENQQLVKQESRAFREVNEVQEGRFYQKIQDQSQKFRQTVKRIGIRRIEELIFQVLRGDIQQLEYLISIKYQLKPQDLIEIRGIDFTLPYQLKLNGEKELTVGLTTASWGLIEFAIYFNQLNVLHYLHKKLQNFVDFSTVISGQTWVVKNQKHVMQVPEIMASEGIPLKNIVHYDFQLVYKGVSMVTKKESLSFIFIDCADLRGYVLAILAKNQIGLRFLMSSCSKHGQHLQLTDLFRLLVVCFMIDWHLGVLEILQSTLTKNTFVLSDLIDKIDFIRICFAQIYSKKQDEVLISGAEPSAQPYEIIQEDSDFRTHNSQMKTLQTLLFSFPFISVTWVILNELGWPTHQIDSQIFNKTGKNENLLNIGFGAEDDSERKSNMNVFGKQLMEPYLTYEKLLTQRELNTFKILIEKNFQGMTISMLESINQSQAILQLSDEKEDDLIKMNEQMMREIIINIQNLEKVRFDLRDNKQIEQERQMLHELKQSQEIRNEIFKLQHLVIKKMKSDGLRSEHELSELTQSLVIDIIIPEINQPNQRNIEKSQIETLNEILQAETIVYISSLKGFDPNETNNNFISQSLSNILNELKYLPIKDMNILHWSIVSKRDDILIYLLDTYFKANKNPIHKPTASNIQNQMQDIKNGETCLDIEPSILSSCLAGQLTGQFHPIEIFDKKDSPYKVLDHISCKIFTVQLPDEIQLPQEISQARRDIRRLEICNLGLVVIIMTKNLKALKVIQKMYPTMFQKRWGTVHGDILDAILVCGLKQWSTGAQMLINQVEVQFVKLSLVQRFRYILKIFQIMKSFRNQNTLQVMQSILSLQKIRNFIEWLSKPAQDEVQQMEIQTSLIQDGHCLQLFPEESQIQILKEIRKESVETNLLNQFRNVVEIEEQICWRQGVYSNIFQTVVQKKNEDAKKKGVIHSSIDQRDIELLNYLIEQGVIIAKQKRVSQSNI